MAGESDMIYWTYLLNMMEVLKSEVVRMGKVWNWGGEGGKRGKKEEEEVGGLFAWALSLSGAVLPVP